MIFNTFSSAQSLGVLGAVNPGLYRELCQTSLGQRVKRECLGTRLHFHDSKFMIGRISISIFNFSRATRKSICLSIYLSIYLSKTVLNGNLGFHLQVYKFLQAYKFVQQLTVIANVEKQCLLYVYERNQADIHSAQ